MAASHRLCSARNIRAGLRGLFPLLELESTLTARQNLVETIEEDSVFFELLDVLRAATRKRNGWKEILRHCS